MRNPHFTRFDLVSHPGRSKKCGSIFGAGPSITQDAKLRLCQTAPSMVQIRNRDGERIRLSVTLGAGGAKRGA